MTTIYNYSPETGEFIGSSLANESPLEPGEFFLPANATFTEPPPVNQGEVAVFTQQGEWAVEPDYRGQTWYIEATGEPVVITNIGNPPEGLIEIQPALVALSNAKTDKLSVLQQAYTDATAADITYLNSTFPSDAITLLLLNHTLTALGTPGAVAPFDLSWEDINHNPVPMSLAQLQGFGQALFARGWEARRNLRAKITAVQQALTVQAVNAVSW